MRLVTGSLRGSKAEMHARSTVRHLSFVIDAQLNRFVSSHEASNS